jgi:hypothetical protein
MSNALGDISNLSNLSNSSSSSINNNSSRGGSIFNKRKSNLDAMDQSMNHSIVDHDAPIKPKNQLCFNLTSFIENVNLDQEK